MTKRYKVYKHNKYRKFKNFYSAANYYCCLYEDGYDDIKLVVEHYTILDRIFRLFGFCREDFDMMVEFNRRKHLVPAMSLMWWMMLIFYLSVMAMGFAFLCFIILVLG